MLAEDLHGWLRALHPVPEPSVDRIVEGDPATEVRGIAVTWMPTWAALREAHDRGANVLVAHEPTYFAHLEADGGDPGLADLPPAAAVAVDATREAKRDWILEHDMVVIRCHDVLDRMPGGIVDSFAAALGYGAGDYVHTESQRRVVRIEPPVPALELARRLVGALARFGQPGLAFHGDPDRVVGRLGLGTGYDSSPWSFVELGADMCITIDDRIKTWIETAWADDSGYPMVVVHHGTSEEAGGERLAELIAEAHPRIPVRFIPQGFRARWIPAAAG